MANHSLAQPRCIVTNTQEIEQLNITLAPEVLAGYFSDPPEIAESPAVHQAAQQFLAEFASEYRRLQGDTPEAGQPAQVSRREFITQAAAAAVAMPLAAAIPVSEPAFVDYTPDEIDAKFQTAEGVIEVLTNWNKHCPHKMAKLDNLAFTDLHVHAWRLAKVSEAELAKRVAGGK